MTARILLVDDDPNLLRGLQRQLRKQFDIETAGGGAEALEAVKCRGPFAVVVSDMRMPGMDGVQLLQAVRDVAPDTVRMMLTGNSDQQTAISAVNHSRIFRFLSKPCAAEEFAMALRAALEQYRLVTAEKELLSKTLGGSISLLSEVLSLVNPIAFGRAAGVRRLARSMCQQLKVQNAWEVEIAAMLSQIGCVTVPEAAFKKAARGIPLSAEETEALRRHPRIGHGLVAKIPRLEGVAMIILYQEKRFDGGGIPEDGRRGGEIPLGARILKVANDFEQLNSGGADNDDAFSKLRQRRGWYDPAVLDSLIPLLDVKSETRMVNVDELDVDMVLDEHVVAGSGEVLVSRGQAVTDSMRERLRNYAESAMGVRQPIRVRRPIAAGCPASSTGPLSPAVNP
jgi:response regulator RpfG family c-di-GMP phosphodiesterase